MTNILRTLHGILWGAPALLLILGVGLWLTVRTGFVQLMLLPQALKDFFAKLLHPEKGSGISSFQALCTALAATVGTGNLVGVAGAISLGGPGAIFWMWICGLLGMATKYAEVTLALRYRVHHAAGFVGGPMYMILQGLDRSWKPLAVCYCILGILAAFGVGNGAQINAVISGTDQILRTFGIEPSLGLHLLLGVLLAVLVGLVLSGGAERVGRTAERLIPLIAGGYIALCLWVLLCRLSLIPAALSAILRGAFSPRSVTGGLLGSAFAALRSGCARGVFTNEAGMGTASMAHASAQTDHPARQGLMGIVEVFLDTIVICTLTALVLLVSGVPIPYGTDASGDLTVTAFSTVCGSWAGVALSAALCCFAFATVLGWSVYGSRCAQFLFGPRAAKAFAVAQTLAVIPGAVLGTETVWLLSEIFNGLMAIPNLIVLAALSPELVRLTNEYRRKSGGSAASGGNYADFHQRKPL